MLITMTCYMTKIGSLNIEGRESHRFRQVNCDIERSVPTQCDRGCRFRSTEFFHRCHKWACFFNFPVSRALGTRLKGRPEKLCDFIGCNFKSRASQKYRVVVISFCRHACPVCDKNIIQEYSTHQ